MKEVGRYVRIEKFLHVVTLCLVDRKNECPNTLNRNSIEMEIHEIKQKKKNRNRNENVFRVLLLRYSVLYIFFKHKLNQI